VAGENAQPKQVCSEFAPTLGGVRPRNAGFCSRCSGPACRGGRCDFCGDCNRATRARVCDAAFVFPPKGRLEWRPPGGRRFGTGVAPRTVAVHSGPKTMPLFGTENGAVFRHRKRCRFSAPKTVPLLFCLLNFLASDLSKSWSYLTAVFRTQNRGRFSAPKTVPLFVSPYEFLVGGRFSDPKPRPLFGRRNNNDSVPAC
jgi:hypothetical protein